jgi:hypothetical protein
MMKKNRIQGSGAGVRGKQKRRREEEKGRRKNIL